MTYLRSTILSLRFFSSASLTANSVQLYSSHIIVSATFGKQKNQISIFFLPRAQKFERYSMLLICLQMFRTMRKVFKRPIKKWTFCITWNVTAYYEDVFSSNAALSPLYIVEPTNSNSCGCLSDRCSRQGVLNAISVKCKNERLDNRIPLAKVHSKWVIWSLGPCAWGGVGCHEATLCNSFQSV